MRTVSLASSQSCRSIDDDAWCKRALTLWLECDTHTNTEMGSESILCVNVCIAIDTVLNFDGDANTDVNCEQDLTRTIEVSLNSSDSVES